MFPDVGVLQWAFQIPASVCLLKYFLCVTGSGAARKGASMFPAVLQRRDDRPRWQEGGGGGGGEHSE